jgi:hypothetical protein
MDEKTFKNDISRNYRHSTNLIKNINKYDLMKEIIQQEKGIYMCIGALCLYDLDQAYDVIIALV